jgi:hypothetical protein
MPDGPKTIASTPAEAMIDPDVAERFASTFVPVWQFQDAPFSAGVLSNEDIRALSAEGSANTTPVETSTSTSTARNVPDARMQSLATPVPDPFAPVYDKAIPTESPLQSLEDQPLFRRSKGRLLVGAGAGGTALLCIVAAMLMRTKAPAEAADLAQASRVTRATVGLPIPAPPQLVDTIETAAPVAQVPSAPISASEPLPAPTPQPSPVHEVIHEATQAREPTPGPPAKSPPKPGHVESGATPASSVRAPGAVPAKPRATPAAKGPIDVDFGI